MERRRSEKGIETGLRRKWKTGRNSEGSDVRRDGWRLRRREESDLRRPKEERREEREWREEREVERRLGFRERARRELTPRFCSRKRSFRRKLCPASLLGIEMRLGFWDLRGLERVEGMMVE